jgi:allantoin racemase
VPYGTLDLGVEEARHVVRIPVVGTGRAATHVAATLCERFAIVCYDVPHVVMYQRLIRAWRVEDFVTSIRPIDVPVTEMASRPDEVRRRLVERCRQAIAQDGAELILPLGLTMVPVTVPTDGLSDEVGAPVLDPLHIAMQTAILLAGRGVPNSRIAYPAASFNPRGTSA